MKGYTRNPKKIALVRAEADKVRKLSDLPTGGILSHMASAFVNEWGYYTFTELGADKKTETKIFVEA